MPRAVATAPAPSPAFAPAVPPPLVTLADLLKSLGGIPASRVRLRPTPGEATEGDVLEILDRENIPCELVDGTLVEKAMGFHESSLTCLLIHYLAAYLLHDNRGVISGAGGTVKLTTGLLRIPDITFIAWDSLPGRKLPPVPVPQVPIALAVEVLSKGNTKAEMERKVGEYFDAGTKLVWIIDPRARTARVFTGPEKSRLLKAGDALEGGDVLPGFRLALAELFAQANRGADA